MSNHHIFAATAPSYWAAGLSVIPLRAAEKRPIPNGWQKYADALPSAELQELWLNGYSTGNIGLVLGPQSGVLVIDVDSEDDDVISAIVDVLTPFPSSWKRVGKKGMVLAYRWNGIQTFRIKGPENNTLVELLSKGSQVVLPPSIHPETQLPYTANAELLDVMRSLVELPHDIEARLRSRLFEIGALSYGSPKLGERRDLNGTLSEALSSIGKFEDGRNELAARIRARIFALLKDEARLTLESFTEESWLAFAQHCVTAPTAKSSNNYTFDAWTRTCQGDYKRLGKKLASKGRLLENVHPYWTGEIVSLEEGTARLDAAIKAFFAVAP